MNCNLTDEQRLNGDRCRSFECTDCRDFKFPTCGTPIEFTDIVEDTHKNIENVTITPPDGVKCVTIKNLRIKDE